MLDVVGVLNVLNVIHGRIVGLLGLVYKSVNYISTDGPTDGPTDGHTLL